MSRIVNCAMIGSKFLIRAASKASGVGAPRGVLAAGVHVEARIEKMGLKIPDRPPPPKGW
jgi:hypothetical protein